MTPRCLVIAGPTAAGKTAASLAVARRFGAIVLSADAMAVYRTMDIGTAKPSVEERGDIPHEGIDVVDPDQDFDAGDFVELADRVLAEHSRVVVVGGTHFYLRSMQRGLVDTPDVDPQLRAQVEGLEDLHAELSLVDPELAERLHANDRVRLVRGIEVFRATGRKLSDMHREHAAQPDRVSVWGLWFDRDDNDERIEARVQIMLRAGYVAEVQGLLDRGYSRDLKPMQSLGYRHLCDHLIDGLDLDEAARRTTRDTRRFARKQRTWLRNLAYPKVATDHVERALQAAAMLWEGAPSR